MNLSLREKENNEDYIFERSLIVLLRQYTVLCTVVQFISAQCNAVQCGGMQSS